MSEHPAGTLGDLTNPSWTVDGASVGIGSALTLLIGMVAVVVLRHRRGTSPQAPAVPEVLDYPMEVSQ